MKFYFRLKRRQSKKRIGLQTVHSVTDQANRQLPVPDSGGTVPQGSAHRIDGDEEIDGHSQNFRRSHGGDRRGAAPAAGQARTRGKKSSKAFAILAVLTISVTICWTPIHTLYTIMLWVPADRISPLLLNIAAMLFALQSTLDPVLFVCALPDLRESIRRPFTLLRGILH